MIWFRAFVFSLLITLLPIHPALLALPQPISQGRNARTLTIAANDKQPGFILRISTRGRTGLVEVRKKSGSLLETLSCPLSRDEPKATELEAVAQEFVAGFAAEDLDFDGYMDLKGPWEFGAKWVRYCVWLYDPESHTFSGAYKKRPLAEQMELLYNLQADPKRRRISSHSIGPVNPMWDEYQIQGLDKDRPYWPRLIPVQSCLIQSYPGGKTISVATHYEGGKPTVTRQERQPEDKRPMPELCGK